MSANKYNINNIDVLGKWVVILAIVTVGDPDIIDAVVKFILAMCEK